jgi:hypothetical protein
MNEPLAQRPVAPVSAPASPPIVDVSAAPEDASSEVVDEASQVRSIALNGAPPMVIRQLGAALIEVTLSSDQPGKWHTVDIERSAGAVTEHDQLVNGKHARRRAVHTAQPGTTYTYRARTTGDWSERVTLVVATPSAPPPSPTALTARAETPFAVRLAWQAELRATSGFEVQVKVGSEFVRAALVDPTVHEFVHHLREPGQPLEYRVRAFNSRGASPPTAVATVTTPERAKAQPAKMGPCVPAVKQAPPSSACDPAIEEIEGDGGRVLYNVPGGQTGCRRRLMGDYKGCRREFGVFELQADVTAVPNASDEGWPLLHAIEGAGEYVGASILTLRFSKGRYSVLDQARFCGERAPDADDLTVGIETEDLASSFPPFDPCQTQ